MFKLLVWLFPDSLSQDALLSCLQKAGGVNWGGKSRGVSLLGGSSRSQDPPCISQQNGHLEGEITVRGWGFTITIVASYKSWDDPPSVPILWVGRIHTYPYKVGPKTTYKWSYHPYC